MTLCIGIDVGLSGAIAAIVDGIAHTVRDMPVTIDGKSRSVSPALLAGLLREIVETAKPDERPTVYIERVGSMPKQGVVSTFNFGKSAGVAEGVVGALGLQYRLVTPQVWKRKANLLNKPKDASRALAIALFPEVSGCLTRKADDGRADALLLAHFGAEVS